ncbi:hypothetical protein B7494_g7453 [Chlorociboria aeruginascens]|nr:hypothetical protein B7494_g7453 [Chlorociboria aeruginascens]
MPPHHIKNPAEHILELTRSLEELALEHNTSTASKPLTEFSYFPELPAEIRLRIWKFLFPGPRLVRIKLQSKGCSSAAPLPITLHICQESREETQKSYSLAFPVQSLDAAARIYFDFKIDTILLADEIADFDIASGPAPNGGLVELGAEARDIMKHMTYFMDNVGDLEKVRSVALGSFKVNFLLLIRPRWFKCFRRFAQGTVLHNVETPSDSNLVLNPTFGPLTESDMDDAQKIEKYTGLKMCSSWTNVVRGDDWEGV